jgi:hypothetical protein
MGNLKDENNVAQSTKSNSNQNSLIMESNRAKESKIYVNKLASASDIENNEYKNDEYKEDEKKSEINIENEISTKGVSSKVISIRRHQDLLIR